MSTITADLSRTFACLSGAIAMSGLMLCEPVSAQDRDEHFEGFSLGIQAGWEQRNIDETIALSPSNIRLADRRDAAVFGAFVGYDQQFGDVVAGIEAGATINGDTLTTDVAGVGSIEIDSRWSADVSARLGYTPAERLLIYARGGYVLNRNRTRAFVVGQSQADASGSTTDGGWHCGGGIEYALRDGVSIRAEYRRNEFEGTLSADQVLGGVALRF